MIEVPGTDIELRIHISIAPLSLCSGDDSGRSGRGCRRGFGRHAGRAESVIDAWWSIPSPLSVVCC